MSSVLLILAALIFIALAYKNIVWGLCLIIILLPSYLWRFSLWGLPSTFLEIIILSLFIVWLIKDRRYQKINFKFSNSENYLPKVLRILLILWLAAGLLAIKANPTFQALGLYRAYFIEPIMFFLVFAYSIKTKKDLQLINLSLVGLVAWLFVVGIWQYFSGWGLPAPYDFPNIKRLTTVFSYPNALGLLLAPLAVYFLAQFKNKTYLLAGILASVLVYLAHSEGALAGILAGLIFWLILNKKTRKLSIIAGIILAAFAFYNFRQQLFAPELNLQATSLEIRSSQWQETYVMLSDHFFSGAGLAGYQSMMQDYHESPWLEIYLYPHNIFLNFWSELGLLGLLVFLMLAAYIIYLLYKSKNAPLAMMWVALAVHGLVDVPYFKNDLSVLFFVMLALTLLSSKKTENLV